MRRYGFVRVGAAVPEIEVSNCDFNVKSIISLIKEAEKNNIEVLVFPELCVTGYTCGDLFHQEKLINESEEAVSSILNYTRNKEMLIVIGAPIKVGYQLFNCAVAVSKGKIIAIIPKTFLPNYNEFYEKRWFSSSIKGSEKFVSYCNQQVPFGTDIILQHESFKELCIGIEICEDLWAVIPPSSLYASVGASLILNLSASNDLVGKSEYRKSLATQQSARCIAGYVYSSAGFGESSTDLVFGGHSMIFENGYLLIENNKYSLKEQLIYNDIDVEKLYYDKMKLNTYSDELSQISVDRNSFRKIHFNVNSTTKNIERKINPQPFVPKDEKIRDDRCEEIFNIQTNGLIKRIKHIGTKGLVIGISGGLDSTLALLVCVKACDKLGIDRKFVKAVTMPGFGTTDRTYSNAVSLINMLGAQFYEISIKDACLQHFEDIGHNEHNHDVTYENTQARERTQILMDKANQINGIVVGTGDLSEIALGWATYNGDHMSMYGVNAGVPKTLVRYLVKWIADNEVDNKAKDILYDVLDTPVSPELLPPDEEGEINQKTEEVVGPYELHDFFLYNIVRFGYRPKKVYYLACKAFKNVYEEEIIYKWMRNFYKRFFTQQFKRSCMPDGPKVGSICLSPRGDWRMPSDASVKIWMDEINNIKS